MRWRPSGSFVVSAVLHVILGAALVWLLSIPRPFERWATELTRKPEPAQRISYVEVPQGSSTSQGRGEGGGHPPATRHVPQPRLTAPTHIPSTVPPPSRGPAATAGADTGRGPVAGREGAAAGVTPSFSDPRVWLPPGPVPSVPKSATQRLDSALAARLRVHQDSMAAIAANAGRKPGDWTFEKNGKKYGIDQNKIYIGDHSIPTAILALLPLNAGTNPIENQRARALNFQRNEIMEQAQRAMNEDEFREAVKRIRQRKEREREAEMKRREQEKKQQEKTVAEP